MQAAVAGRLAFSSSSALYSSPSSYLFTSRRRAIIGKSGALHRFNIKSRGKSFTASVPSDSPKPQKGKRIPIEERRALVESFVNKYRTANAGRFPSISFVRQEIGGSHYTIRQIIQELEYNQKFPLKKIDAVQSGKVEKVSSQNSGGENYVHKRIEKVSGIKEELSIYTYDQGNNVDKIIYQSVDAKEAHCGKVEINFQSSEAKEEPPRNDKDIKEQKVSNRSVDVKKVPSACDGSEIVGLTGNQSFNTKEEHSASEADQKIEVCDQILDVKVESSSFGAKKEMEQVDGLSFGLKLEPDTNIREGSSVPSKLELKDDLQSSSEQFVVNRSRAEKNTILHSQNIHGSRGDKEEGNNIVTDKEGERSELCRRPEHEESSSNTSSMWKNLRSLAAGIISLWKKQ